MKVIRNINNNVAVCVDDNNHELIAFGRGIGFKKAPYEIDLASIDRTYYNLDTHYISLLDELPEEIMDVGTEIVQKASSYLDVEFSKVVWFTLCDHINFAIENVKKGLVLSNPITNEIQHLYEKEMLLGEWSVKLIEKKIGVKLASSEAGSIAVHFINAEQQVKPTEEKDIIQHFIDDISDIVESEMNIIIERNSFNYSRFVTHLKYLLKRSKNTSNLVSVNVEMYEEVYNKYPEIQDTIEKIKLYLMSELDVEPNKEELLYLMIHINRLCAKEGL